VGCRISHNLFKHKVLSTTILHQHYSINTSKTWPTTIPGTSPTGSYTLPSFDTFASNPGSIVPKRTFRLPHPRADRQATPVALLVRTLISRSVIKTSKTAVDQFLTFISAISHLRADRLRVVLSSLVARRLRMRGAKEGSRLRHVHDTT
jgi:hypothetical protein